MFIMKKKIFEDYCKFIFPILFELEKQVDLTGYDNYQKRQISFLAERLTSLFLFVKKKQGYKFKTIDTLFFSEWKPTDAKDKRGEYSGERDNSWGKCSKRYKEVKESSSKAEESQHVKTH